MVPTWLQGERSLTQHPWQETLLRGAQKNALNHLFEDKISLEMSRKGMLKLLGEEYTFKTYKIFPGSKK